jgi:hypothetical protein
LFFFIAALTLWPGSTFFDGIFSVVVSSSTDFPHGRHAVISGEVTLSAGRFWNLFLLQQLRGHGYVPP